MDRATFARMRALIEKASQAGFCVITSTRNDGRYVARAFCIGNYREDLEESADTEDAAVEAVTRRIDAHTKGLAAETRARARNGERRRRGNGGNGARNGARREPNGAK